MKAKETTTTKPPKKKQRSLQRLFVFCGIIIILSFFGYKILNEGIYHKGFVVGKIKVEGFYLKLENKFILEVDRIDLSETSLFAQDSQTGIEKSSEDVLDSVVSAAQSILFVLSYFEKLNLYSVIFPDKTERRLLYDGMSYALYAPDFEALLSIQNLHSKIILGVQTLRFFDLSLECDGYLEYYVSKKNLDFALTLTHNPILKTLRKDDIQNFHIQQNPESQTPTKLNIHGTTNFKHLNVVASSSVWRNIQFLESYIKLLHNKELESWLFEKIKFRSFELTSFDMQIPLNKDIFFHLNRSIKANAILKDVKVSLDSNIAPINAREVALNMRDDVLDIAFTKPSYVGYDLTNSKVRLKLPFSKPLEAFVSLHSKEINLDKALLDLLEVYEIPVPVMTQDGALKVGVEIHLKADKFGDLHPNVQGEISSKESTIVFLGQKIKVYDLLTSIAISSKHQTINIEAKNLEYQDLLSAHTKMDIDLLKQNFLLKLDVKTLDLAPSKIFKSQTLPPELDVEATDDPMVRRIIQAILEQDSIENIPSILTLNTVSAKTNSMQATTHSPQESIAISQQLEESPQIQPEAIEVEDITQGDGVDLLRTIEVVGNFADESLEISIPQFSLVFEQDSEQNIEVGMKNIHAIYPYSPLLQYYGISEGSLVLTQDSLNEHEIFISANLNNLTYPIYRKDKTRLSSLAMEGIIDISKPKPKIELSTQDKKFSLRKHENTMFFVLDSYDVNLDELLSSTIPVLHESFNQESQYKELSPQEIAQHNKFIAQKRKYEQEINYPPHILYLEANNMQVYFGHYTIPTDSATITLRDEIVNMNASYGNGIANVDVANHQAKVAIDNFSADFINKVMQKRLFEDGLFELSGIFKGGVLQGKIHMQNTIFKEFVLIQNILALIDAIPSLVVFRKPGLNDDGYEIKNGSFMFWLNDEYLGLDEIDFVGTAIDISGNGLVDFKSDTLNLLLQASTMKTLSDIISSIPIVGFLILGDEGKITTNIVVSGELSNPKTEVSLLEDVVTAPFKILRRVFTPFDSIVDALQDK